MKKNKKIISIISIICLSILFYLSRPYALILIQHQCMSKKLDNALLSNNPSQEFKKLVPEINKYSSVKKAWFDGSNFFIEYKKGGIVSWTISPKVKKKIY